MRQQCALLRHCQRHVHGFRPIRAEVKAAAASVLVAATSRSASFSLISTKWIPVFGTVRVLVYLLDKVAENNDVQL